MNQLFFLLPIFVGTFIAIAGYALARRRNRCGWIWAINCFLSGLLGLLILSCSKNLDPDQDKYDNLGGIMFVVSCIYFGITSLLSYYYFY